LGLLRSMDETGTPRALNPSVACPHVFHEGQADGPERRPGNRSGPCRGVRDRRVGRHCRRRRRRRNGWRCRSCRPRDRCGSRGVVTLVRDPRFAVPLLRAADQDLAAQSVGETTAVIAVVSTAGIVGAGVATQAPCLSDPTTTSTRGIPPGALSLWQWRSARMLRIDEVVCRRLAVPTPRDATASGLPTDQSEQSGPTMTSPLSLSSASA